MIAAVMLPLHLSGAMLPPDANAYVWVPWLLLGLLVYPFLVGVAWRYTRVSDRVEQNFADHVQD